MASPQFYVTYDVDAQPEVRPIVRYRDGGIALTEARRGRGKVMVLTRTLPLQIFFSLLSHLQNYPKMRWRPALRASE
jgi:hypothetical protein